MSFTYTDIVCLYDASGNVQNEATFTHLTESIVLELRQDINLLGEMLLQTGANWTAYHYNWTQGTSTALPVFAGTTQKQQWLSYITDLRSACEDLATTAGISAPTWTIATASLTPLYDNTFALIPANIPTYTDVRKASLYEDVRTAILAVADTVWVFIDSVSGNDTTGNGSYATPYQTWEKGIGVINTAGAGNLFMMPGAYTKTATGAAVAGTVIEGASPSTVTLTHTGSTTTTASANDVTFRNMKLINGGAVKFADGITNLTIENCYIAQSWNYTTPNIYLYNVTTPTISHCTFIADNVPWWAGIVFGGMSGETATITDCLFYDIYQCISTSGGTYNIDHCGFYSFNPSYKLAGTGTFNNTNEVLTNPYILDKTTSWLTDTYSPDYKGGASDGGDIGVQWGEYNVRRVITDTLTMTEPAVTDMISETITDTLTIYEDLSTTNMGVTVSMMLGGLLQSATDGTISYLDSGTSFGVQNPLFTYNGASVDISYTNTSGSAKELYIAVDDGVTNYETVGWWETNAWQYGSASRNYAGRGTDPYFIDAWKDVNGNEWGSGYTTSTAASSDGVNHEVATVTIKLRIKDYVSGAWSEVVTATKSYDFSSFDSTMYYCADNPRMVDGEYANHANYLAQAYHTGTGKYTRPDGVDWIDDDRRFAYIPAFKIDMHVAWSATQTPYISEPYEIWQSRQIGSGTPGNVNRATTRLQLYSSIYGNFGNWNENGDHCFAVNSTQAHDACTNTTTENPALTNNATDLHYLWLLLLKMDNDCAAHNSHRSTIIRLPSGENLVWGDFIGDYDLLLDSELEFRLDTKCSEYGNYFYAPDTSGLDSTGFASYPYTGHRLYVNTDNYGTNTYGSLGTRAEHWNYIGTALIILW